MKKRFYLQLILFFTLVSSLFCEETSIQNLHNFKLENGLTLFVAENHAVPLVYTEIAFRTGGLHQTKETAGLFHLFEHMLFNGNDLYPDSAAVNDALQNFGLTNYNGTTSTNRVNFFFEIPSHELENGLKFWNAVITSSKFDKNSLENEKKVVISEITKNYADLNRMLSLAISKLLYPESTWKDDISGPIKNIQNATVEQLLEIKENFFIPNNAALFIGGDVDPKQTFKLVNKIFGSWSNNGKDAPALEKAPKVAEYDKPQFFVFPTTGIAKDYMQTTVVYAGPGFDNDKDGFIASYHFMNKFSSNGYYYLYKERDLQIPNTNFISNPVTLARTNGKIKITATTVNPLENPAQRTKKIQECVQEGIKQSLTNQKLFNKNYSDYLRRTMDDKGLIRAEIASDLCSELSDWWAFTDPDLYFSLIDELCNFPYEKITEFYEKYFSKNPIVITLINPEIYEQKKDEFEKEGFKVITIETAPWWSEL